MVPLREEEATTAELRQALAPIPPKPALAANGVGDRPTSATNALASPPE